MIEGQFECVLVQRSLSWRVVPRGRKRRRRQSLLCPSWAEIKKVVEASGARLSIFIFISFISFCIFVFGKAHWIFTGSGGVPILVYFGICLLTGRPALSPVIWRYSSRGYAEWGWVMTGRD